MSVGRRIQAVCALAVMVISGLRIVDYIIAGFESEPVLLTTPILGVTPMAFTTAVCFFLVGCSLWLETRHPTYFPPKETLQ